MLENECLSIRRTAKTFSRTPIDQTLEQTINADTASRKTGIAAFSTSAGAKRRWMVTSSVCSELIGELMEMAVMTSQEDGIQELKKWKIQKDL